MTPKQTASAKTPKQTASAKWTKGDFKLVSSDNVVFWADSVHVLAASIVFYHMRHENSNSAMVVEFTDDETETAATVDDFLSLITTTSREIDTLGSHPQPPHSVQQLANLTRFLKKYDCPQHLKLLFHHACEIGLDKSRLEVFIVGAKDDNPTLCCIALHGATNSWSGGAQCDGDGGFSTNPPFMPIEWFRKVPCDYLWALTCAWQKQPIGGPLLAAEFQRLIEAVRAKEKN